MTTRPEPHVAGAHVKKIRVATARFERLQAQAEAARAARDDAIRDAFADRVPVGPIAAASNVSKDRAKQIKRHTR